MIKHLAPRTEEEIKAVKDKEYLRDRKSWSGDVRKAVKTINHIDFLNYHKIKSIRYNVAKEKLKINYKNKTSEILFFNENITKWLNKAMIEYNERNFASYRKTDINKIQYNV